MPHNIKFKSTPTNWRKEFLGLKRNTVRFFTDKKDIRKEILDKFINGTWNLINIEIENSKTYEVFTRGVTDVTYYEGMYIISW